MSFSDQAIILKRYSLGEADRLVTLLTRRHGKLIVVAKGVRRPVSRKAGSLELFNYITGFFVETKGLPLIIEVKLLASFEKLKEDLQTVGEAWYVCELADSLLHEGQEGHQVFNLLLKILQQINELRVTGYELRNFEIELLKILGFWSDEIHGRKYPKEPAAQARFNRVLIQQIIEKDLKTPRILEKW